MGQKCVHPQLEPMDGSCTNYVIADRGWGVSPNDYGITVPQQILPLVVLFKLDHHISGAKSTAIQISWSKSVGYLKLFWN